MAEGVYGFVLAVELVHAEQAPSEGLGCGADLGCHDVAGLGIFTDFSFCVGGEHRYWSLHLNFDAPLSGGRSISCFCASADQL